MKNILSIVSIGLIGCISIATANEIERDHRGPGNQGRPQMQMQGQFNQEHPQFQERREMRDDRRDFRDDRHEMRGDRREMRDDRRDFRDDRHEMRGDRREMRDDRRDFRDDRHEMRGDRRDEPRMDRGQYKQEHSRQFNGVRPDWNRTR